MNVLNLNFHFIKSLLINVEGLTDASIKFMLLDVSQIQTDAPIATFEFDMFRLIYEYFYPLNALNLFHMKLLILQPFLCNVLQTR